MTLEGTRGGDAAREAQRALLSNERQRAEELAARLGLEFVDLTRFRVDSALFHSVSFEVMLRYGFVPLAQLPGRLQVAMKDPGDIGRLDDDIWFWHQWRLSGKTIYVAPSCAIGHLEETVAMFDDNMQAKHIYVHEWRKANGL